MREETYHSSPFLLQMVDRESMGEGKKGEKLSIS